jgi:hypothetical protein
MRTHGWPGCSTRVETALLPQINPGPPPETWARYQARKERRDARTLTPEEYTEFMALTNGVELWNARRLELALALVRLRHPLLRTMMGKSGLIPQPYT